MFLPDIDPFYIEEAGKEKGHWVTYVASSTSDKIRVVAGVHDGKVSNMSFHGPWKGCIWAKNEDWS